MTAGTTSPRTSEANDNIEASIATIRTALSSLKYGSINVMVHEGRVVQIDVTEKNRLKAS